MSWSHTVTTIQAAVRWVAYGFLTSLSVPLVMAKTSVVATAVTMETVKVIACTYRQGTWSDLLSRLDIALSMYLVHILFLDSY